MFSKYLRKNGTVPLVLNLFIVSAIMKFLALKLLISQVLCDGSFVTPADGSICEEKQFYVNIHVSILATNKTCCLLRISYLLFRIRYLNKQSL